MAPLETAIGELRLVLAGDSSAADWRWNVRLGLSGIRDTLATRQVRQPEAWLTARSQLSDRDRSQLRGRVGSLAAGVLDDLETEAVVHEVDRLLGDLEHHVQRNHDLVYDSVSLELGGSE